MNSVYGCGRLLESETELKIGRDTIFLSDVFHFYRIKHGDNNFTDYELYNELWLNIKLLDEERTQEKQFSSQCQGQRQLICR